MTQMFNCNSYVVCSSYKSCKYKAAHCIEIAVTHVTISVTSVLVLLKSSLVFFSCNPILFFFCSTRFPVFHLTLDDTCHSGIK